MTNELSKEQFEKWKQLQDELDEAVSTGNQVAIAQVNTKILAFGKECVLDPAKPVTVVVPTPPGPPPIDKTSDAYKSGYAHGLADLKIKDSIKRYINQPNKGPDHHSASFMQGYNDAFGGMPQPPPVVQPPTPTPSPPPSPPPVPAPTAGLDQFGLRKIFPDKAGGVIVTKADVEYKIRHYSSGKPSEPTVELTITVPKSVQDIESTAIVTMTGMSHNDTIDWKHRGPPHQDGSGKKWYCIDQETDGGNKGKKFQVEDPHPTMHNSSHLVTTYYSPPNLSNARFGWKGITVNKAPNDVYIACWINPTPDDQAGWRKVWDIHDTGQVESGQITPATGGNIQIRIDGIKGKPLFEKASVREISYSETAAASK